MALNIKQGVNETIELELPFSIALLSKYTVDIYQGGEAVISKDDSACTEVGDVVSVALTQTDTLKLSPQRASVIFRGLYADGSTVIIEDIPCTIGRSDYREVAT